MESEPRQPVAAEKDSAPDQYFGAYILLGYSGKSRASLGVAGTSADKVALGFEVWRVPPERVNRRRKSLGSESSYAAAWYFSPIRATDRHLRGVPGAVNRAILARPRFPEPGIFQSYSRHFRSMAAHGEPLGAKKRLDSWKEIAAFFGRDERTVKRWEKERGLPVYRVPGSARGGVFAYAGELAEWLKVPTHNLEAVET